MKLTTKPHEQRRTNRHEASCCLLRVASCDFVFHLPDRNARLRLTCWPQLGALVLCLCMASATIAAQTLTPPRVAVFGIVLDQTGAPVAGAQVSLRTETSVVAQAQTGNDGSFTFEPKTERPLILVVNASGFARFEQALTTQTDAAPLRIVLVPAPLAEQITITATRTEARLDETAASVAVLSRAQLATTSSVTLDDALRQVAGFSLFRRAGSRTANPTTQGGSLRGGGASGASRALVVSDGVPLNDPFGGWVYWGRVPREAVSRVEVLRGGASELYGSDALGGFVNIITRHPAAPAATLELSYGNEQTPDASLFVGATRAGWGVRLSAEEFRTDGYVLVDERERGRVDTQAGARHATLDLTIERKLNQAARLFLRGALFGEARTNGTPVQTNRTHIRELSAGGDWASARFGSFALRAYGSSELFDQNFSAIAGDRNSEQLTRVQRAPAQVVGFNAQWSRAVGTRQTVVAGFDARAVRGASNELVFAQGRATSFADAGGRERTGGLFVEEIIRAGARLFLTGGVRADHWRN